MFVVSMMGEGGSTREAGQQFEDPTGRGGGDPEAMGRLGEPSASRCAAGLPAGELQLPPPRPAKPE